MKKTIGYTTGVFDLFHIGHLNLLRNAKAMCDILIVGVSVDELVKYKGKTPIIPYEERAEIVRNINFVDLVIPQYDRNKLLAYKKIKFNKLFVGDDWYNSDDWKTLEKELNDNNVEVIYFPYTKGTSSTLINNILNERKEKQ